MQITCDPHKRAWTLRERGLDFMDAGEVFAGDYFQRLDDRKEYGEARMITAGYLRERMVVIVWTPRGDARHIISMRYAHAKEEARWKKDAAGRSR